jgi:RNA polymerase subunit RPABC4/transcription elongation factor Spt4
MEGCRWCGATISEKDTTCPECGTRLRRTSSRCRRCKEEIRSGLAVCPYCGEDLLSRRVPWTLVGTLAGVVLVGVVGYLVLSFVPLPIELPFVASVPTATPTEVILPPTPTDTATPRPPTSTPTRRPTATPVITETATLEVSPTRNATATSSVAVNPAPTAEVRETPPASPVPTETPGLKYAAPRLIEPEDESNWAQDHPLVFSEGARIELQWEAVGTLGANEYYAVELAYVDRDSGPAVRPAWVKETTWVVPSEVYDRLGSDRIVEWSVTVVSGTPGTGQRTDVSPASETWMFRWG